MRFDPSIDPSLNARNLGAIIDNSLSMNNHIKQICKSCFYHIHNIRRISKFLSKECLQTLVHAFVTSRLDYYNSLLYGQPKYQILSHSVSRTPRQDLFRTLGSTTVSLQLSLIFIGWQCFIVSILQFSTLTFKAIHGMSPSYISDLVSIRTFSLNL